MNTALQKFSPLTEITGRVFIALIFVISGFGKIGGYEATQAYMTATGVPGALLPLVILTELGGGLLIILGLFTRYAAFALAGFSILSGILFHGDSADQIQQIMLLKNVAMAGGFLFLVVHGAGPMSIDSRLNRR